VVGVEKFEPKAKRNALVDVLISLARGKTNLERVQAQTQYRSQIHIFVKTRLILSSAQRITLTASRQAE
jgi:hypothetical protein